MQGEGDRRRDLRARRAGPGQRRPRCRRGGRWNPPLGSKACVPSRGSGSRGERGGAGVPRCVRCRPDRRCVGRGVSREGTTGAPGAASCPWSGVRPLGAERGGRGRLGWRAVHQAGCRDRRGTGAEGRGRRADRVHPYRKHGVRARRWRSRSSAHRPGYGPRAPGLAPVGGTSACPAGGKRRSGSRAVPSSDLSRWGACPRPEGRRCGSGETRSSGNGSCTPGGDRFVLRSAAG